MSKARGETDQLALDVHIRAKRCVRVKLEDSSDGASCCKCDDGSDYVIKDGKRNALIPHSEWFCTHLGEAVGLASPQCKVVDVQGERCFGSRWQNDEGVTDWWLLAKAQQIDFQDLAPTLSRILAFDLFVNNVDRHLRNYIVRSQPLGAQVLAFDYSRAWLVNGMPPPPLPMRSDEKTIKIHRMLKDIFGDFLIESESIHVLDQISAIDSKYIERIIDDHPLEWLTAEQRTAIVGWWNSDAKSSRIDGIRKGVRDGSYL